MSNKIQHFFGISFMPQNDSLGPHFSHVGEPFFTELIGFDWDMISCHEERVLQDIQVHIGRSISSGFFIKSISICFISTVYHKGSISGFVSIKKKQHRWVLVRSKFNLF
jgi:hypothetical protein